MIPEKKATFDTISNALIHVLCKLVHAKVTSLLNKNNQSMQPLNNVAVMVMEQKPQTSKHFISKKFEKKIVIVFFYFLVGMSAIRGLKLSFGLYKDEL